MQFRSLNYSYLLFKKNCGEAINVMPKNAFSNKNKIQEEASTLNLM
jgi:hypothetical protein